MVKNKKESVVESVEEKKNDPYTERKDFLYKLYEILKAENIRSISDLEVKIARMI